MADEIVNEDIFEEEIPPDEGEPLGEETEAVPEEQAVTPITVSFEQYPELEGVSIGDIVPFRVGDITEDGRVELNPVPREGIGTEEVPLEEGAEAGGTIEELSARLS